MWPYLCGFMEPHGPCVGSLFILCDFCKSVCDLFEENFVENYLGELSCSLLSMILSMGCY